MDPKLVILDAMNISLRTGRNLYERYGETRGVNKDLDRLSIRIEGVWEAIESRLAGIQSSLDAVHHNLRARMEELLRQLLCLLHTSYRNLEKTKDKNGRTVTKTIKFALFQKRSLEKDVSALGKWRDRFDSTSPMLSITQSPLPTESS